MTALIASEETIPFPDIYLAPSPTTSAALVTGAGHRLGRAIARDLARNGWPVVLHYNGSEDAVLSLKENIENEGGMAAILSGDLTDERDAETLMHRATNLLGPIGILINNASVFEWDDPATATVDGFSLHMDLHLRSPLIVCQKFVEQLPEQHGGLVINMLDSRVLNPTPKNLTYTLSKSGLWTLTRTLAQGLAPRVRVNGIGPGPTLPHKRQTVDEFRARCSRLPLKRPASLTEVCETVRFLISQRAITGQMIALDGGDHLVGYLGPNC